MAADRVTGAADAADETSSEQRDQARRPPPDRPGAEGFPSRAESRAGAAAANKDSSQSGSTTGDNQAMSTSAAKSGETQSTGNELQDVAAKEKPAIPKPSVESQSAAVGCSSDEAGESTADTASSVGTRRITFKLEGGSLRARIDPEGDDADAAGSGGVEPVRSGDRTAAAFEEGESDDGPRLEKFRNALHKNADSIVEKSQQSANSLESIFGPRPKGEGQTAQTDGGPSATDAPHSSVDPGNIVSTGLALGIAGAELFRRGREKIKERNKE